MVAKLGRGRGKNGDVEMNRHLSSLPNVRTGRLHLRPLGALDAEAFRAMTDEPTIIDVVHFLARPFTIADAEKLLLGNGDGQDCFWGVYQRDAPTLIGTVGTHLRGVREIEIGYWFAAAIRGRGLAAEAVTGIIFALRAAYPDRSFVAECRPQNEASWRLLEKIGFKADGTDGTRPGRKRFALRSFS